ncbi:MAG: hypothetical protein KGH84_10455 [Paracoccaceae bacterium]|nr:hypothetical protein [Paracoccaceae bacterium]
MEASLSPWHVEIRDRDRLIKRLPDKLTDALIEVHRRAYAAAMAQNDTPAELASMAQHLRDHPLGTAPSAPAEDHPKPTDSTGDHWQKLSPARNSETFKTRLALSLVALELTAVSSRIFFAVDARNTSPFVADLLSTDGLFSFPNPVARQNLIRDLRAPNSKVLQPPQRRAQRPAVPPPRNFAQPDETPGVELNSRWKKPPAMTCATGCAPDQQ